MIAGAANVRKAHFDTGSVEPEFQFEAWRQSGSPFWDLSSPARTAPSFAASRRSWQTGRMVFMEVQHDAPVFGRPCARRLSDQCDSIGITLLKSGSAFSVNAGKVVREQPGGVYFNRSNASTFFRKENVKQQYVGLSYGMIGFDPGQHPSFLHFPDGSAANRLIQAAAQTAFDVLPAATPAEAAQLEDGFCALIRSVALKCKPSDEGAACIRDARRRAMRKYADDHLSDRTFGIDQLAQAFHVSGATVKRDFADAGGLSAYLWRRRLDGALLDLTAAREPHRGLVGDIAIRWCFQDESSFRRAFRREFGFAPGEAMGRAG